jgi:TRAP-type C4-dicarboxylate transport system permease small subunit
MRSTERCVLTIERVLDGLLGVAILVMAVSMAWQVIGRYAFGRAPGWSEELCRFLMLWVTMLGSAAVLRRGGHLTVTVLLDVLPPWACALLLAVRDALMVAACGMLAWQGWLFAELNGAQDSAAMEIAMTWPYASISVGSALILLMVMASRLLGAPFLAQGEDGEGVL